MRFNKQELITLATLPTTKFEQEGLLFITERQEGIFRRADVNFPRWCKLRGNLLFYLKDHDPYSPPIGVIVLENCRPLIRNEEREFDGFVFILEFEGIYPQRISTRTAKERLDWVKCIQLASYSYLNRQIEYLSEQIALAMGNRIEKGLPIGPDTTTMMSVMHSSAVTSSSSSEPVKSQIEEDLAEIPICESAISCDSLPPDDNGRIPSPMVVVQVAHETDGHIWREYARTEVIERCANPQFLCTMCFRQSHNLTSDSLLRFTVYDVREKVSQTSVPFGYAEIALGVIQDATRFRIPLRSITGSSGFITIASWAPDPENRASRSPTKGFDPQSRGHRRSQSLPSKLGYKLFVPSQLKLQTVFANPTIHTYRLHSSLGGDISVQEVMLESKLCFVIPQQLLSIWIIREKELLQEISGMGELGGKWRRKQIDLLDKHLKLLKDYSQAKQNLQQITKEEGPVFKRSSVKTDEALEFIPVNLHMQRMWSQNDTLNRLGVVDVITVGAFTRHAGKQRTGGLIKLLQQSKHSPSRPECGNAFKVQAANATVQTIKQLRKEIVEIMSQLLCLAKTKNPKGMMPLCSEMVTKTRTLLNIWEPSLVEEAFTFIEQHRILDEPDNVLMQPLSPFRKITQQLSALDLKSPELEDFATPVVAPPDLWPRSRTPTGSGRLFGRSNSLRLRPSPSATDINAIFSIQNSMQRYSEQLSAAAAEDSVAAATTHQSLPISVNYEMNFRESHFDASSPERINANDDAFIKLIDTDELKNNGNAPATTSSQPVAIIAAKHQNAAGHRDGIVFSPSEFDEDGFIPTNCSVVLGQNIGFLDMKMMSTSPSANYYRPTEEPEPLDLTQLNIEASIMCLVSKIKFLCGRCGSPAIRLRHPKTSIKRAGFSNTPAPDVVISQSVVCSSELVEMQSNARDLNLELSHQNDSGNNSNDMQQLDDVDGVTMRNKRGNKFTDGLDLSMTTDWASELRPSMRKLRHAMDGLLKTARLMHSVQRLQQDMKQNSINLDILYRRDVCFSQALTALVSALMAKLWGTEVTENFMRILCHLGPLAYFEGLLSLYGGETDMWGDMCIAIEDLLAVNFTLVRSNVQRDSNAVPTPRVTGSRQSLTVLLPIPESVYTIVPTKEMCTFKVTPVFFNIGINEKATLSETLGLTREQHRSNVDNFFRIKHYYGRFRKLNLVVPDTPSKGQPNVPAEQTVVNLLAIMEEQLRSNVSKNVKILHLAEDICRLMFGLRFTSCKSAKDRTGMAVTLEQCRILLQEFHLPAKSLPNVLSTMRSEGTRMDNVVKNIGKRKYAFNLPQVLSLPSMYRPPTGSYGKAET